MCVLLGVSDESKGYIFFDPVSKKIIVSRDVTFEEKEQQQWGEIAEQYLVTDLEWGEQVEEGVEEDKIERMLIGNIVIRLMGNPVMREKLDKL